MKLINSLFTKKNCLDDSNIVDTVSAVPDMNEREKMLFGNDNLTMQRLYEKWICKDEWVLESEGIPLLLGVDPVNRKSGLVAEDREDEIMELWQHARNCVKHDLLTVVNSELDPDEWRIAPADLYQWASVSRISMPHAFVSLIEFVLQTIKKTDVQAKDTNVSASGAKTEKAYKLVEHKQIVLGAALALVANRRESCVNRKGNINVTNIVNQIIENENIWFGEDKPLISHSAMQDLIKKYLNSIGNDPGI